MNKTVEISTPDFFTQKLKVGLIETHSWEYCKNLCEGKKVLHIGCSDWPIFNPEGNLHIHLSKFCSELHGCDPNGLNELSEYCKGVLFESIESTDNDYDVILAPNIFEHLTNPGIMVKDLFGINFKKLFVLVPNAKVYEQAKYEDGVFIERVHPDHYFWFSPFTIYNLFKTHIEASGATFELNFFDNMNMISILITKP